MKKVSLFLLLLLTINLFSGEKDILVIESYHSGYSWDQSYISGLKEVLADSYNLHFFEMDTKRLPSSEHQKRADLAWEQYKSIDPVLVILGDDNALKYLEERFAKVETPVVYLGINNNPRNYNATEARNITGVLERPLLKRSVAMLKDMIDMKKILILFDSGTTAKVIKEEVFGSKNSVSINGVEADIKLIGNFDEWKNSVNNSKAEGYDTIIIGLYHTIVDKDGKHIKAGDILKWSSKNTPLPPFSFWDFSVGSDKTIGGYVLFGKDQGIEAAKMAQEILNSKEAIKLIPRTGKKGRFLFSKKQMDRWNIKLPAKLGKKAEFID